GGFAPSLKKNSDAIELIINAIVRAVYTPGSQIEIAIDPASCGFYENGLYLLRSEGRKVDAQELFNLYSSCVDKYP
ncbi:phosphopyruvate hydratase, partial [Pseudomonas syringae pv. tagetis]